jgi:hypothetical protein
MFVYDDPKFLIDAPPIDAATTHHLPSSPSSPSSPPSHKSPALPLVKTRLDLDLQPHCSNFQVSI